MIIKIAKTNFNTIDTYVVDDTEYNKWLGSSCQCFKGTTDNREYIIKQFLWMPEDSMEEATKLHNNITSIINLYNEAAIVDHIPYNYLMRDAYIGKSLDGQTYYQIFPYLNGKTLEGAKQPITEIGDIKCVLTKYIHLLYSLRIICDKFNHLDISLNNIYERADSGPETKYEIFDFGSLQSKEEFQNNAMDFSFRSSSSRPYYLPMEEETLKGHFYLYNGDLRILNVLDTSACARVLAAIMFGEAVLYTKDMKLATPCLTIAQINNYLIKIPHEGVQIALQKFFKKALYWDDGSNGHGLENRYLNFEDMIFDINCIIDAFNENPKTVKSFKIREITQNSVLNKYRDRYRKKHKLPDNSFVSMGSLLKEIDTAILSHIKINNHEPLVFDDNLGSPLAQLMALTSSNNLLLVADGGCGKSSALLREYFLNLINMDSQEIYVYVELRQWENKDQSFESFLTQFIPKLDMDKDQHIVCMLDAFDENKIYQDATQKDKQKFIDDFCASISCLKSARMVVTSRVSFKCASAFDEAFFLPLNKTQISKFLNIGQQHLEEILNNKPLSNLLNNALMLSIFKSIRKDLQNNEQILSPADLINLFFINMYENKNGKCAITSNNDSSKNNMYNLLTDFIADDVFSNTNGHPIIGFEYKSLFIALLRDKLACYAPIVEIRETTWDWSINFSHTLYKDYFLAKALSGYIKKLFEKDKITPSDLVVLGGPYSNSTLEYTSQMLFPESDPTQRAFNNACFEKLYFDSKRICMEYNQNASTNDMVKDHERENRLLYGVAINNLLNVLFFSSFVFGYNNKVKMIEWFNLISANGKTKITVDDVEKCIPNVVLNKRAIAIRVLRQLIENRYVAANDNNGHALLSKELRIYNSAENLRCIDYIVRLCLDECLDEMNFIEICEEVCFIPSCFAEKSVLCYETNDILANDILHRTVYDSLERLIYAGKIEEKRKGYFCVKDPVDGYETIYNCIIEQCYCCYEFRKYIEDNYEYLLEDKNFEDDEID
ncbi:MAG: hypothetical protein IKJ07_08020 [Clostridia bacterium]|nr:hypothetical protein [Clostridia bacterium]